MTPDQLAAIAARNEAPWEIEKWLITIKAHCTVIADSGGLAKECADRIKQNIDDELRPALLAEVARLTAELAEAEKALDYADRAHNSLSWYATQAHTGSVELNGREMARQVWGAFSEFYELGLPYIETTRANSSRIFSQENPGTKAAWDRTATVKAFEAEAEQRGYDAAKEQAAKIIDNFVAHLNLEQFLLILRDKGKAAEISQAVIAILECEAAAIRAMVRP